MAAVFIQYLHLFTASFICWNWQLVLLVCGYYTGGTITWISLHLVSPPSLTPSHLVFNLRVQRFVAGILFEVEKFFAAIFAL